VIQLKFLKEPENFEELAEYHSLAREHRAIFEIKEEKKKIQECLVALENKDGAQNNAGPREQKKSKI